MIKAVFFDFYQTLVGYDPPREEIEATILKGNGISIKPELLQLPFSIADAFFHQQSARRPFNKMSPEEQKKLFVEYQTRLLSEAGIKPTMELIKDIIGRWNSYGFKLVLFDDALPAVKYLNNDGLTLGLISNIERDITPLLEELGLSELLEVVTTSLETGYTKPNPEIFKAALKKAGVKPEESVFVGDQYGVDVLGSKSLGMKGILLDRNNSFTDITDCPRINNLLQLKDHLD